MNEPKTGPTWEELQQATNDWLLAFENTARAQDANAMQRLFSKSAVVFGAEKGGLLDWPPRLQFAFVKGEAKAAKFGPFATLTLVDFSMQPIVHGGEVKRGRATIILQLEKRGNHGEFVCIHAHFSPMP